jgi:two-component system response regulator VicR
MAEKIMIVDDEPDTVEVIKLIVESGGYQAITAHSGPEALEKMKEQPDAILLDIMMPEMDGWEVLRKIKEKYNTPVAMLTAKSQNIDKMIGLHVMKADDYITKPFGKRQILDKIEKLIKNK